MWKGDWVGLPREIWRRAKKSYGFERRDVAPTVSLTSSIKPRDDKQERAFEALSKAEDGLVCMSCGSGKTPTGIHHAAQVGGPVLVLVNQTSLAEQWGAEFRNFCGGDISIGRWYDGQREWDRDVVLATLQSAKLDPPKEVRSRFALMISDECHCNAAETFSYCIGQFAGRRLFLTATPERQDGLTQLVYDHSGPLIFSDTMQDLTPTLLFVRVRSGLYEKQILRRGRLNNGACWTAMANNVPRVGVIVQVVERLREEGRKILILSGGRELCAVLAGLLECPEVTGDTHISSRKPIMERSQVIAATLGVAKEGLDLPDLDTVVLVTPVKSGPAIQQAIGRTLRTKEGKKNPLFVYIQDDDVFQLSAMAKKVRRVLSTASWLPETPKILEETYDVRPGRGPAVDSAGVGGLREVPAPQDKKPAGLWRRARARRDRDRR